MDILRLISEAEWRPGIGDPSFMGWLTVILYFLTAFQCFRVYRNIKGPLFSRIGRERLLWFFILMLIVCLGFNKQLDFQSLLTEIGKTISIEQGWYNNRRTFQLQFIMAVVIAGSLLVLALFVFFRKSLRSNLIAILGTSILVMFIIIRASSFHHFDYIISSSILGLKVNWLLEIGGISLILFNTIMILSVNKQALKNNNH